MGTASRFICVLSMGAALAAAVSAPAFSQGFDLRALFNPILPKQESVSLPSDPDWSGESGASGHPLMTAQAIRAAAANFPSCLAGLWPLAARRGVPRALFDTHVAGLTPELHIMDLLDTQPEFTRSVWDYLDLLVSEERIQKGRAILARHRAIFDEVEKAYGVDRHIIVAIWGIESDYGKDIGERSVLRSTATLACIGRRQDYFRDEFLSALEILARGDVRPEHLKGSWAGAFGPTQFMPTSFKRFAVDFDGDGRRDVVDSVPDLIASTANNLKKDGWVNGQTWGYEVRAAARLRFPAGRPGPGHDHTRVAKARDCARERQAVSARRGQGLFAAPRRRAGSGISHAAELPRDHEIQSRGGLRTRDRLSGRPPAQGRGVRPAMAPAGTRSLARGAL